MTREELVQKVKVKLEELSPFDYDKTDMIALEGIVPNDKQLEINPIYSYIDASLNDSCNEVLNSIPLNLITPREYNGVPDIIAIKRTSYYKAVFNLPKDYLRLYSVCLHDWCRQVMKVASYEMEQGVFSGNIYTMGKPSRPMAIEDYGMIDGNQIKQLHCYSTKRISNESQLRYVPRFETEDFGGDAENNCEKLSNLYSLMTAMNVCLIYGNKNGYELLSAEYQLMLKSNDYQWI